ncbi:enoyl-CoA hydratase-related protein [Aeromicrobium sp.]|uniref:enoyl-CoA hydratase/isomerase family protein n=1 Tax=Aeromicrobium sp. TaxID=1871063 RepID=UPI0025C3C037|nr:enoyl-CoA hydratase-related protein [Aeromicrobium sp.]MCK5892613.1 enoyl-CoA hydratase/isomerase family protein [Aeromicrobium sp.]
MTDPTARTELETCFHERVADGVVLLTLNRPAQGNSVVPELARDLMAVLDELEPDRSVRVVVLTGAGRQFSAGADMVEMQRFLRERLSVEQEPYNARVLFPVTQRITTSRLVFVAAVNGGATAGGLDFALACDLRIASDRAKLGETYVNMGLAPGNGGTWFLPRLVGSGMAAELALTGDVVTAERALEIGLVGRVVPHDDLLPTAIETAGRIAAKPWRALEATKQALRASWQLDLTASMAASFWTVAALYHTDDLHEAVDAYVEKRPPRFNRDVSPET